MLAQPLPRVGQSCHSGKHQLIELIASSSQLQCTNAAAKLTCQQQVQAQGACNQVVVRGHLQWKLEDAREWQQGAGQQGMRAD
jgi:hypothetical protein